MSVIMFDTNAYRGLALKLENKSEQERSNWISSLKNKELAAGHKKELNFWVVCELLKHLENPTDGGYKNCLLALEIALDHCTCKDMLYLSKPFESDIADYYKIEQSRIYYHSLSMKVADLAKQIVLQGRTKEFEELIPAVGKYITDFQDMMIPGFVEAKDSLINDAEFQSLRDKGFMDDDAYKMIVRSIIHGISKIEGELPEADVDHFLDAFYFGVARVCRIIDKTPTTKDFKNHLIDAEICLRIGKTDDRVIISNDGTGKKEGLINTFEDIGAYPDKAMTTEDYYRSINFEIDDQEAAAV